MPRSLEDAALTENSGATPSHVNVGRWLGTLGASGASALVGLATSILVARLLLPEGRGLLATAIFWPAFIASLGALSLPGAITYQAAVNRGRSEVRHLAPTVLWLSVALSFVLSLLGLLILPRVIDNSALLTVTAWYLVMFMPFHLVACGLVALDQGRMRFARFNLQRVLPAAIYLVGLCVAWGLGKASVGAVLACQLVGVISTALFIVAIRGRELWAFPSLKIGTEFLATGIRFHAANVFTVVCTQIDTLVVVSLYSATEVGLYAVALGLAGVPMQLFLGAFSSLLFVRVSEANEADEKNRLIAQSVRYATLFLAATAIGVAALAPLLIPALFGSAFRASVHLAQVLAFTIAVSSLRDLYTLGLMGFRDWKIRIGAELVMIAVFVLGILSLSPLGIIGVPIALLLANAASLLFILVMMRRYLGVRILEHWGGNIGTIKEIYGLSMRATRAARPQGKSALGSRGQGSVPN